MRIVAILSVTGVNPETRYHKTASEFVLINMAAVIHIARGLPFASLYCRSHFLNGSDALLIFHDSILQLIGSTHPVKGDVPIRNSQSIKRLP